MRMSTECRELKPDASNKAPVGRSWLIAALLIALLGPALLTIPSAPARAAEVQQIAFAAANPAEAPSDAFVELNSYIPDLIVELPYATAANLSGRQLYSNNTAYLRKGCADKLVQAVKIAAGQGYRLKLWDAYRPQKVQEALWAANPNPDCLVNPASGFSNHTRGAAVDVTLVSAAGQELAMPSTFDDFSGLADRDYNDVTAIKGADARILQIIMEQAGFESIHSEWWHFNEPNYRDYAPAIRLEPAAVSPDAAGQKPPASSPPGNAKSSITPAGSPQTLAFWEQLLDSAFNWLKQLFYGVKSADALETAPSDKVVKISAVGDCTLGGNPGFDQRLILHNGDYAYFFAGVAPFLQKDDLTIANLENAFTLEQNTADKSHQPQPFYLKGPPDYARILNQGSIEAVNLANNHTYDYLQPGFNDTCSALDSCGIMHFGYGEFSFRQINGCSVAMAGYNVQGPLENGVDIGQLTGEIQAEVGSLQQDCDLVIVSFHWGDEGSTVPSDTQRSLGRWAVDCGADLVLGHGPHVIQPVELYQDRYIVYSLGNFSFGGNDNPPDRDTFIYTQQFAISDTGKRVLEPVCIPCRVSSSPESNDYRPVAVYGSDSERILGRIAW